MAESKERWVAEWGMVGDYRVVVGWLVFDRETGAIIRSVRYAP